MARPVTCPSQPLHVRYEQFRDERDLPVVMDLIDNELSEPYSIFTYRYFLRSWPQLCFLAYDQDHCFGTIVCKVDDHRGMRRGYLAMLVVEKAYRAHGIGTALVKLAIDGMMKAGCEEVALEAEVTNTGAIRLYENLGFIRDKALQRYYLSGADAFRLKLLLPVVHSERQQAEAAAAQLQQLHLHPADQPQNGKG